MDYNAINTKIIAMGAQLLGFSDYYALSQLETVEEIGMKLKERPTYRQSVESLGDTELRRANIEQKLVFSLSNDFSKIYKFLCNNQTRKFLDSYFLKNEVNILKYFLYSIYDSRELEYSLPELTSLISKKLKIDIIKLKNAKSVAEFIESLSGTEFYKPLQDAYTPDALFFELEMQLDLHYYIQLWDLQAAGLDKANTAVLHRLLGVETDLRNIIWIYRLKTFYNVPNAKIYSYLIPHYYHLKKNNIIKMVEAKTKEALLQEISVSQYSGAFSENEKPEKVFLSEMAKLHKEMQTKYPNSLASTFFYLFQKELEIKNITSLIECVRYKLPTKDILKYLTITRGTEVS